MGFVVDKLALGQVFSEYFSFLCQSSFHQLCHAHLSFGAGAIGQLVTSVLSGLNLTPPHEANKKMERHRKTEYGYSERRKGGGTVSQPIGDCASYKSWEPNI
jgi:hypothetical protein